MSDSPAPEYPRDDLYRMVELPSAEMEVRASEPTEAGIGTLFGYAARFNEDTTIDSWEGNFRERIMHGAFRESLKKITPKVLFNHGFDPSIGEKPLGRASVVREDDKGLYVEVPLDDTSYNRDLAASIRSGALDGMSFRFSVKRDSWDESGDIPTRTLQEVRLYEFGPVTFPAYQATTAGVRSREAYQAWRSFKTPPESDAADAGASDPEPDTQPILAPVEEPEEAAPAMPVRRLDVERIRNKAAEYAARAEKIERTSHG